MRRLIPALLMLSTLACSDKGDSEPVESEYDSREADVDGDGLSDFEEKELYGTDPNNPDTDGDGFADGAEVDEHGTSPLNDSSHPYAGGYNVGNCDTDPVGTGPTGTRLAPGGGNYIAIYEEGDIVNNFEFNDVYDEQVELYSFCGRYVTLLFFGMDVMNPSQEALAKWVEEWKYIQEYYREYGYELITILTQNQTQGLPTQDDLTAATALFGFTKSPVLALPENQSGITGTHALFEADWHQPTVVHLGPGMEVLSVDVDTCAGVDRDPCQYLQQSDWVPKGLCWDDATDWTVRDMKLGTCACPKPECDKYCGWLKHYGLECPAPSSLWGE